MKPEIMQLQYSRFKENIASLVGRLVEICAEVGDTELLDVAHGLVRSVNAPFLFVVVGEVKAGKSSFINALLGEDICAVAPDPCTDVIQKIVHAPRRSERIVSDQVREVGLPNDILREVAIVDTPGTNSIIERHQEITERFIPEADLAIFVFPAVNPYARSAWELFRLVHSDWHKKIIFVLQQADRASPAELKVNLARVAEYARERGVNSPRIFPVSAKLASEGKPGSGMQEIWDYISSTVTGGRHYVLKMESLINTGLRILDGVQEDLRAHAEALDKDRAERLAIARAMERSKEYSLRDADLLKAKLVDAYRRNAEDTTQAFREGLGIGTLVRSSLSSVFKRKRPLNDWLEGLGATFNQRFSRDVEAVSREAASRITENISRVMEILLEELKSTRSPRPQHLGVSGITNKRLSVINTCIDNVLLLLRDESLSGRLRPTGLERMGEQTMVGGFLTAVGAIIAATVHTAFFDVTGGILSMLGALLAINTLTFKRRGIVRRFEQGFEEGRERFERDLSENLAAQIEVIYSDLDLAFQPFYENIREREERLANLKAKVGAMRLALDGELSGAQSLVEAQERAG
ncbi:dynamin family protein [Desulfocurvibacter africanus]|uniref:dynamin family protein n=1 Tax=Desulfocurvibacter africanus TaxID=873 RepID=UPI00041CDE31|nr:dynamin family protein [Desulfocurvibacter africanus]